MEIPLAKFDKLSDTHWLVYADPGHTKTIAGVAGVNSCEYDKKRGYYEVYIDPRYTAWRLEGLIIQALGGV